MGLDTSESRHSSTIVWKSNITLQSVLGEHSKIGNY